jgi:hypothetical protein
MKNAILMCLMTISSLVYSQVGINTPNPQGVLHVDGAQDNPTTGTPTAAQQSNDFTVGATGNVGLGTTSPAGRLHVYNSTTGTEIGNDYIFDDESPISNIPGLVMRRSNAGGNLAQNDFIGAMLFNPKISGSFSYGGAGIAGIYRGTGTNFLTALIFRINNNQEAARIDENGNVGIGTTAPTAKLDVNGSVKIVDGTQGVGKIFVSDANGLGSWQSPAQTKEILALGNSASQGVLTGVAAGGSSSVTNFTQIVNTIAGSSFNATTDVISLPQGTYEISVSFELTATGTCPAQGFLINSYFIDFPNNGGTMRVHANSPSVCGTNSIHSASWITTVVIPAGGQNWSLSVGRGVGGNYSDVATVSTSSRILVKKIL